MLTSGNLEFGLTSSATASAGSGSADGRAGAVLDALVEVPVGVGKGRVGREDAGDGAAAQLAVVLLVARDLTPEPVSERQTVLRHLLICQKKQKLGCVIPRPSL